MYRYKRILLNLNLDERDAKLIKHASRISQMAQSEKLYFLYTEKQLDIPSELAKEYPQLTESVADFAREKIQESINNNFTGQNSTEQIIVVEEGQELDTILKQVRINGIDLVVSSVSEDQAETRNFAAKLARKAPCSVLVIPDGSEFSLQNPAVAVDFSENAADAMDAALAFTKAANSDKITMMHVYQIPTGYHKTGKSYDEFSQIMKGHAEKRFEEFKSDFKFDKISVVENYLLNNKTADAISENVEKNQISFLAIGARGRNSGASVLLGSVAEKMIESLKIPVLAVKKKGSGLNILKVLFN